MPCVELCTDPGVQAMQVATAGPCCNMAKGHHIPQASHPATQAPTRVCGQAVLDVCNVSKAAMSATT
jgi:hypothetical protein